MPTLQLHGPPAVVLDDGGRLPLSEREAALLAWLHLEGPTARGPLAGRLWPGGDDAKARTNLRQLLLRLRRVSFLLEEREGLLHLAAPVAELDAPLLSEMQLDAMPEMATWLAARREAAARTRLRQGLAEARALLARGELEAALAGADHVLAADDTAEEAHRVRMEVFYLRGDRAAAIAAWDACRQALRAAFGVAPTEETNALGRLVMAQASQALPALSRVLPAALQRPPHMVGREGLLQRLQQAAAAGQVLVLAGPGGIGKSRLLHQLAAAWPGALGVGARPGDAVLPGELLARLLGAALDRFGPTLDARLADDLARVRHAGAGPALQSAAEHRRVLRAVTEALQACRRAGLQALLIDDLQFADEASLAALHVVLGPWLAGGDAPVLVLGARADELPAAGSALLAAVAAGGRGARFDIGPLAVADVQTLLVSLPWPPGQEPVDPAALAEALHGAIGGNPAWLLEALKNLWLRGLHGWRRGDPLPLPPTLLESLRLRLQHLPPAALQLAQLAALAERDFSLPLAAAASGSSLLQLAPALAALQAAQVFDGLAFGHDLVAEAAQRSLPEALRPPLHRLVAEHLVAHGGVPARIGHHLQAAGDSRAAAPWLLQAAQAARADWQLAEAAAAFEAAARGFDPQADASRALAAWRDAARCWMWMGHERAAQQALKAAEALPRDETERCQLSISRAAWLFNTAQLAAALAATRELLPQIDASAQRLPPADLVFGLRLVAALVPHGLAVDDALALARRAIGALSIGDDGSDSARIGLQVVLGTLLHWASRPLEAVEELEAAWARASVGSELVQQQQAATELLKVRHSLGDLPGAIALAEQMLPQTLLVGVYARVEFLCRLGLMQVASGYAAAGLANLAEMQRRLQEAGEALRPFFMAQLALAEMAVGRLDAAAEWLARHEAPGRPGQELQDQAWLLAQARLAAMRGEPPAPWLGALQDSRFAALASGPRLQQQVIEALLVPPPLAQAESLLERLQRLGLHSLSRSAAIAAVRSARAAGANERAVAHARTALALQAAVDAWADEPATLWPAAHDAFAAAGLHDEARAMVTQGAAWVEAGSAQWAEEGDRRAWREGHPLHRWLLQRAGARR